MADTYKFMFKLQKTFIIFAVENLIICIPIGCYKHLKEKLWNYLLQNLGKSRWWNLSAEVLVKNVSNG